MDGLDALSTTYLPTVEPARLVSRPPRYTKEFSATLPPLKRPPVNLRRGPPTCILAHLLTPHDCHVHQWGSSDSKIFSFRTNRHRVAIFLVSFRTLKHLLEKRPWKIKGTCGLLPVFQILLLGFMCANPVNRDRTAVCWPCFAPFSRVASFLSFYSFSFLSLPHSPLFLMASSHDVRLVCLVVHACSYSHDTGSWNIA